MTPEPNEGIDTLVQDGNYPAIPVVSPVLPDESAGAMSENWQDSRVDEAETR